MPKLEKVNVIIIPTDESEVMAAYVRLERGQSYYIDSENIPNLAASGVKPKFEALEDGDEPVLQLDITAEIDVIEIFAKDGDCNDGAEIFIEIGGDEVEAYLCDGYAGITIKFNKAGNISTTDVLELDEATSNMIEREEPTQVMAQDI